MLSILLINDNKIVSRLLQLSSKKSGFDIEESGIFSPQKEFYNLVFVDSDKYTEELLEKIKENLTYDKLVFIGTAQVKKPDGFELVLEKPFLPTDFTALIEKNFIVGENINNAQEEDIEQLLDEDEIDIDSKLEDFDDEELFEDSSTEDLAQMVDEINDLEDKKEEELSIEDEELFEKEDDLGINDELLETDEEDKEEEEENSLPDIDDEIEKIEETESEETKEEINSLESKNEVTDEIKDDIEDGFEKIDKGSMKQLLEPNAQEREETENEEIENEETKNKEVVKTKEKSESGEDKRIESNIEELIKEKLEEVLTPELIKSALKDMKFTISFEDKE